MIYFSWDLETSGNKPKLDEILEVGIVMEDTKKQLPLEELPRFHAYIIPKNGRLNGNLYALNLNKDIIHKILNRKDYEDKYLFLTKEELPSKIYEWMIENGLKPEERNGVVQEHISINVAGKNFATFDKLFLSKIPKFEKNLRIRSRLIDPAICYADWFGEDECLPDLKTCKERAKLEGEVAHTAIEDALDIIKLMRLQYKNSILLNKS